jgi:hypothetical protein
MFMLALLIELCEVCMKEVFKCRDWRVMRWDEVWTKAQAWGCPCHPKKYPGGTRVKAWGCPRGSPSSSIKIRSPFNTLFLLLHILCVFLEASLLLFLVFFYFACCNKWLDPKIFFLEKMYLVFHCQEHSIFYS